MKKNFTTSIKGWAKNAPRRAAFLSLLTLLVISAVSPLASAYTQKPPIFSSSDEVAAVPWDESMRNFATQNGKVDPAFDMNDPALSIVIITSQTSTTPTFDQWQNKFYYTRSQDKLLLKKNIVNGNVYYTVTGAQYHGFLMNNSTAGAWKSENPAGNYCANFNRPAGCENGWVHSLTQQSTGISNMPGVGNMLGIVFAKNVVYDSSWDGTKSYNSELKSGVIKAECETLDIVCHLANVFGGIKDTMSSVGQAVVTAIASMFKPDTGLITQKYNELKETFLVGFGFLSYPFEFLGTFFASFYTTSDWCGPGNCQRTFGNIFGSPFTVNFLTLKEKMPIVWDWAVIFIRGAIVITLIFTFKNALMAAIDGDRRSTAETGEK